MIVKILRTLLIIFYKNNMSNQFYLNNQRRMVLFDTTTHTINSVIYRNDIPHKGTALFDANEGMIDRLISQWALQPMTPVTIC